MAIARDEMIDFSCKHGILIRYQDGVLRPMDEPHFEARKIANDTWQIMSSGDYHYLLGAEAEGIAIDTGYGAGNLRTYLESILGKAVPSVIDTHYHFDHTAGNAYFERAYMGKEAVDRAGRPYQSFAGIVFLDDYEKIAVSEGEIIPLKGRELEVFYIADHTEDGIAILDRKERLLFTGDELMPNGKTLRNSVQKFHWDMEKLMSHRSEYDFICGGPEMLPADIVTAFYEASEMMLKKEGKWQTVMSGPPAFRDEFGEGGELIYDWKLPHAGDGGHQQAPQKGKEESKPAERRRMVLEYKGYRFVYDPE